MGAPTIHCYAVLTCLPAASIAAGDHMQTSQGSSGSKLSIQQQELADYSTIELFVAVYEVTGSHLC